MTLQPQYRAVLDALGDATIVSDLDGRVAYANPAAQTLTGWQLDELAGQPLTLIMPERLRERHLAGFRRYVETRVPRMMGRAVRLPLLRRDGVEVEIELTLAKFPDDLIIASLRDLRDRVELERQSELLALLDTLLTSAPVGVGLVDRELRYVRLNDALAAINGRPADEHVGRAIREVLPLLAAEIEPIFRRVFETGEPSVNREVSGMTAAQPGERRDWLVSHYPVRGPDHSILGVGVITVEITERRIAQREREQSDRLRKAITDNATVGLMLMDERQHCTFMNPAAEKITGFSFAEVQAKCVPLHYIIHHRRPDGSAYPMEECPLDRALPQRDQTHGEDVFVRADGSFYDVAFTASPLLQAGRAVGTVIEVRDITHEKRARAERDRIEAEQRFLADASQLLLSTLDYREALARVAEMAIPNLADWCVIDFASNGAPEAVAVVHSEPRKAELVRALRQRIGLSETHGLGRVLQTGEAELIEEIPNEILASRARDAESLALLRALRLGSAMIVPLKARGRVMGAITLANGDSERRFGRRDLSFAMDLGHRVALAVDNAMLYQQAQDAIRLRDDFLSIASHELRTPLTPLQLQLDSLEQALDAGEASRLPPARLAQKVQRSRKQVERLSVLVTNLLDVSRIQTGTLVLNLERVDFGQLVREVVGRFSEDSARLASKLKVFAQPNVFGSWDRLRIEQVVANLVSNAEKYGAGKPIHVEVSADAGSACLVVSDQGIGIEPEQLNRIFGKFERAVSPSAYGGLGLGLYIIRQILEAHGGTIRVDSHPGAGSTFKVFLPLDAPHGTPGETHKR